MWLELVLLGIGLGFSLAMDAFSVSLANGLNEPKMRKRRLFAIAGIFAGFQFLMPLIGWLFVSLCREQFQVFEKFIPWIALGLLGFIGGKMLYEGIKNKEDEECEKCAVGIGALLVQGVATSIDALSSGFAIASKVETATQLLFNGSAIPFTNETPILIPVKEPGPFETAR